MRNGGNAIYGRTRNEITLFTHQHSKKRISDLFHIRESFVKFDERFEEVKINQGLILSALNERLVSTRLQDYEFKVFSQWGEDGIIRRQKKQK